MKINSKKKIYIALSGGVDSAVSAALLKKQGFDVTGVFIKVWQPDFLPCTWKEDRREAMRVCAHLGAKFFTLDLEKEYKKEVVDYMIKEYKKGQTPNPDVMCNKYIKFGSFFKWAIKNGADYVATGHYAQTRYESTNKSKNMNEFKLLKSKDSEKDQTYFLWTLTKQQLSKTFFPIGNLKKQKVRRLSQKFKLPNADKKDSQGLCFIGKIDMKEFLSHYLKIKPGKILNEKGKIIGHHDGALLYTIGERHGFIITKKANDEKPYFVIGKNLNKNTLVVSNKLFFEDKEFNKIKIRNTNWINEKPQSNKTYEVRLRHRGTFLKAKIILGRNNGAKIELINQKQFIAPGQSAVVYKGNICLGGGIVDN